MNCQRCSGYMILESHYIPDEIEMTVYGWRCLNCGEVIDQTILHNRQATSMGSFRLFCRRGTVGSPIPVRLNPTPTRRSRRGGQPVARSRARVARPSS